MKNIILFIVAFATIVLNAQNPWNGNSEPWTKGDGTVEYPFQIETAEQLAYLAEQTNTKNVLAGSCFLLMNDLDLGGRNWTPIGSQSSPFIAKFNGNNRAISNLHVNITEPYAGLFGYAIEAEIKNVGITGESTVYTSGNVSNNSFAGGIVGVNWNTTVINCHNNAAVSGNHTNIGGIVGQNKGSIYNCYNTGNISGVANFVGGITGYNSGGMLSNCYNSGKVSSSADYVGGISGACNSSMTNCYNVGTVSVTGKGITIGGITGYNSSLNLINCYQLNGVITINGVGSDGTVFGEVKTEAEMKTAEFITTLNAEQETTIWFADSKNVNVGYPILKYQIQYVVTVIAGGDGTVTGGGNYSNGSQATLTATPNTGYKFVKWNDGNVESTRVITVISDATYTAEFVPIKYILTVTAGENGTVLGGGEYDYNTEVTLTAIADTDYIFAQWGDGNTENPRKVIVTANATYTAEFAEHKGIPSTEDIGVRIYPNPMTTTLTIEGDFTSIELYNSSSKLVFNTTNSSTIDVSNLSHGVYIIKAYNNDKVGTYKIVK